MREGQLHVTKRQRQVLDLAADGRTDKEIASILGLSVSTVRSHLQRFYRTNGLRNKVEAVGAYLSRQSSEPE
jgi:DNA-binding CsgD family transcriptional regulator